VCRITSPFKYGVKVYKMYGFVSEWPMVQPWKGCVDFSTESSNNL